jgi:hypothetical protein
VLDKYIQMFVERGAIPDITPVYRSHYNTINFLDFEKEVGDYDIRGPLIDIFSQYIDVTNNINWTTIKETYYEDILSMPNHGYDYETARLMALKYHSKYLTNSVGTQYSAE